MYQKWPIAWLDIKSLKIKQTMEGNKDEALRCVELAEKYLAEGKYDKAEKFLHKGQKLFPTSKAESTCHRSSRPI